MRKVISVETKNDYILSLVFDNGISGDVSVADCLYGPMFEPLKDPDYFSLASVDEYGVVCWPNQADLAPEGLYKKITGI